MGAFLLVLGERADANELTQTCRRSLEGLQHRADGPHRVVQGEGFVLFLFPKRCVESTNLLEFEDGGFLACTGSLIYRGRFEEPGMRALYEEFSPSDLSAHFGRCGGQFCVVLRKEGALYLFNDATGLCGLYRSRDGRVFSNSFLAVARAMSHKTFCKQGLWEYVFWDTAYGEQTILQEVGMVRSDVLHCLAPTPSQEEKHVEPAFDAAGASFEEVRDLSCRALEEVMTPLCSRFGDRIATALSGGYDTRLMLAFMRKLGVSPYVYVYGAPRWPDVMVASAIAEGEGFDLHVRDKSSHPRVDVDAFPEIVRTQYFLTDGQGTTGAFDDGADLSSRLERVGGQRVHLNGGGGEIFRNIWRLPDIRLTPRRFVSAWWQRTPPEWFPTPSGPAAFHDALAGKIRRAVGVKGRRMTRGEIDLAYARFRIAYWQAKNNSTNSAMSHSLTPYCEPSVWLAAATIPLRHRSHGKLQAAMLVGTDPALASYISQYGHAFDAAPGAMRRLKGYLKTHVPVRLRAALLTRRRRRMSATARWPYFLDEPYLKAALGGDPDCPEVRRFVNLDRIRDPAVYARALTAEMVLRDVF